MLRLERMEILGFKSFYGKTRFDFPAGITAVVGPNGCGKSNIGDAINWVLGDQSPKSLRGDRMEDVIFSGTQARKPLGMAEVTLTLQDGIGAAGADPIVITRRLYRSGESEYLINGERSRLKDLRDLLENRRIAAKMSSVIEQGKIDEVINSKPKDRRLLFEEAAGIAGNKIKKRLAGQKLESAEGNLDRVHDILSEVEAQVRSVRRQAAKARRYRRLTDRIRQLRAVVYREKHRDLVRRRAEAIDVEQRLREAEVGRAARLSSLEAEWERLSQELSDHEERLAAHRDRMHRSELDLERHRGDRQRCGEQRAEARQQLDREAERLREARRELAQVRELLGPEGGRFRGLERQTESAQQAAAAAGAGLERRQVEARDTEQRLESVRTGLVRALEASGDLKSRVLQLEEQGRGLDERLGKLDAELGDSDREARETEQEWQQLSLRLEATEDERRGRQQEKERTVVDRDTCRQRLETLDAELDRSERRLVAVENKLELLRGIRNERRVVSERVRTLLSGNGGGGRAPDVLGEGVQVVAGLERALDAALGPTAQAFVMADGQRAASAARSVRDAGEKGTRFVWNVGNGSEPGAGNGNPGAGAAPADPRILRPLAEAVLDTGPRGEMLVRLVRRTLVARDLGAALELHREQPEWNFVTPAGEMVHAEGILEDGTDRSWGAFSLESELGGLEREQQELCGRRDGLRREIASLRAALEERETRIEELARSESEIEKRELSIRLERDARRAEGNRIARRRESLETQRRDLEAARRRIDTDGRDLRERLHQVETERTGLQRDQERLRAELQERQAVVEEARALYQKACSRRDGLEIEHRAAAREVSKLRRREEDLLNRCEATGAGILALEMRRDESEAGEERARIEIHRLEERIAAMAEARAGIEADLEVSRAGVVEKKEPIREARREREAALAELREAELGRTRLDSDLEHLLSSCREELGCAPEEIPPPGPEPVPPFPESEREVEDLKEKLQRIGPVNLVAVEELEQLEERQKFLTDQRQDLIEAIASLRNTIQRLNRESRERFVTAFEEIRGRFQGTFEKLFGGGRAQLRLEESDDPLQAGVEIIAQPPGKRLQSIRLMSGGEKALTAIALLFAVFQYRPSPFCVLDEVDAPLDEANVERFSRMLRHFNDETQFILITHSRRTMENADNLYGVTMEESGISKVMSLQLERGRDH